MFDDLTKMRTRSVKCSVDRGHIKLGFQCGIRCRPNLDKSLLLSFAGGLTKDRIEGTRRRVYTGLHIGGDVLRNGLGGLEASVGCLSVKDGFTRRALCVPDVVLDRGEHTDHCRRVRTILV